MMAKRWYAVLVVLLGMLCCAHAPITGRRQLLLLSQGEENQMGAQAFQQVVTTEKVDTDPNANALVKRVGERIAAATKQSDYQWEFKVIDKALDFWKRMEAAQKGKAPPEILSDHPADEKRVQQIEQWMPEAMSYYKPK